MSWRPRTFLNQLLLVLIGFVLIGELAVTAAILNRTYDQRLAQARDSLAVADRVLDELLMLRADQLLSTVRILASDYGFRSAIATQDEPTQRSVLENFGARANAAISVFASPEGDVKLARPRFIAERNLAPFDEALAVARNNNGASRLVMVEGMPYQMVIAPMRAPELIGWIGMGFLIDEEIARNLASVTGVGVGFIVTDGQNERYRTGSTDALNRGDTFLVDRHILLDAGSTDLEVVLSLSRGAVLAPFYDLATSLALVFVVTVLISAAVAWALARRLARPVHELSEFAQSMATGHYRAPPTLGGVGEFSVLTDALNNMQLAVREREQRIRHQATHDAVTDLLNRVAVRDLLYERLSRGESFLMVRVAIYGFARMNTAMGYRLGDAVINTVAQRLKSQCRDDHTVARIEGNDFLVLTQGPVDAAARSALIATLRDCVEQPVYLQSTSIQLRAEVGVVAIPQDASDIESAWRRAVIAQDASRQRRGMTFHYETGLDEARQRELTIIQGIAPAAERGELSLQYQPKMHLADRRVRQVEALVRWNHSELGPISPEEFIRLAEGSGQIHVITRWVAQQACRDIESWMTLGCPMGVAVNLSADEIAMDRLIETMAPLFDAAGGRVPLTFEVTESALLRDPDQALQNLRALEGRGGHISVDDFGTGYSSMEQLKQLAADELKIDKSFVIDLMNTPADQFIVETIVDLAHKLRLGVVAEGVEDAATLAYLDRLGVDLVQGYHLARPMGASHLPAWLDRHHEPSG